MIMSLRDGGFPSKQSPVSRGDCFAKCARNNMQDNGVREELSALVASILDKAFRKSCETHRKQESIKLTAPQATIIAAIIAVLGIVVGSFLNPLAEQLVNKPTPTPSSTSLAIEQIPQHIFAYAGNEENLGGYARLDISYDGVNTDPSYVLEYNLPEGQSGYAGLAFQFNKGQNVSAYRAIEFTIQFQGADVPVDLFVRDISGKKSALRIFSKGLEPLTLQYELEIFKDVDFNALKEIGFNSDGTFSFGDHTITIHAISFVP